MGFLYKMSLDPTVERLENYNTLFIDCIHLRHYSEKCMKQLYRPFSSNGPFPVFRQVVVADG